MMNQRLMATETTKLIKVVGGVKTACQIVGLGKTRLYAAQDPSDAYSLPTGKVAMLENYCGEPIVSTAMARCVQQGPGASDPARLPARAMEECVAITQLARDLHHALEDGRLSPNERNDLTAQIADIQRALTQMSVELSGSDPAQGSRQTGSGAKGPTLATVNRSAPTL